MRSFATRVACVLLSMTPLIARAKGGGSTAGGGPVVYQAEAIKALMSDDGFLVKFNTTQNAFFDKIERVSWANGVTHYRVTSNGGCNLDATLSTADGLQYQVSLGDWECPSN